MEMHIGRWRELLAALFQRIKTLPSEKDERQRNMICCPRVRHFHSSAADMRFFAKKGACVMAFLSQTYLVEKHPSPETRKRASHDIY